MGQGMQHQSVKTFRTFLTFLMFAGIPGCGSPIGNPDEAAVVTAIQKLGGKVEFEGQGKDQRVLQGLFA